MLYIFLLSLSIFLGSCFGKSHKCEQLKPVQSSMPSTKVKTFKDQESADANIKAKGPREYKIRNPSVQSPIDTDSNKFQ